MFDIKSFMSAQFVPREEDVPVPDMAEFFDEGEKPVWRVKSLTGQEMFFALEAAERNRKIKAVLEGITSEVMAELTSAVRKLVGDRGEVTDALAKKIEMFAIGSVAPKADIELAIKVCRTYPVEFTIIAATIEGLTGMGHETKKKPSSSGTT